MIVQDQSEVMNFLARPETHGITSRVKRIATHISEIFLAGERAIKLKRAEILPYLDFSTPQLRLAACRREVELNRRTAPQLYLGVRKITRRRDAGLALDGQGEFIDAVVEMVRFDENDLYDRMADGERLTAPLMRRTADKIAEFHASIAADKTVDGAALVARVLDVNERGFAASVVFDHEEIFSLNKAFRVILESHSERLVQRGVGDRIVLGHGDLHLRNICLYDGQPTLFDCIEFSDEIATVDVLYDLAFLIMDLWHRDLRYLGNLTANRYVDRSGDDDGYCLLPFFMALRAAVRALVTATQVEEAQEPDHCLAARARSYFNLARDLLVPRVARIIAIGGLSGSGKSRIADTLAPRLAAPPGARILESDRFRKRLYGVAPEMRLPQSAYDDQVSERVYGEISKQAGKLTDDGVTIIADAVYADPDHRADIEAAAGSRVAFTGFWLEARADVLRRRIELRDGGASDADIGVLNRQMEAVSRPANWICINTEQPEERTMETIMAALGQETSHGRPGENS